MTQLTLPLIHHSFIEKIIMKINLTKTLDYSGINHFIQIYSASDMGWFGDFNNKNLIIYGIKETNSNIYNNDERTNIDLYNIEHWIYDRCENILEINRNLFSEISHIISNYSKSICLR